MAAVAAGEAVVVGDVAADARYLTTHTTTRSEIVVPIFSGRELIDLIDVESEQPDAFGARDRQAPGALAAVIVPLSPMDLTDAERARG